MNITKLGRSAPGVAVRKARQTPKAQSLFSAALRGGAQVLLAGARLASGTVGGPLLSAAVSAAPGVSAASGVSAAPGSGVSTSPSGVKSNETLLEELQQKRMEDDLRLLALQDKIQQQNRQISLLSNVMRAKHETAKSAISNIRA